MSKDMVVFRETTEWSDPMVKNGTYILSPDKQWMYGFIPSGKPASAVKLFKNRIQFDKRHRTFVKVKG